MWEEAYYMKPVEVVRVTPQMDVKQLFTDLIEWNDVSNELLVWTPKGMCIATLGDIIVRHEYDRYEVVKSNEINQKIKT